METRQVNIRLPAPDADRLDAFAFIRRSTAGGVARDILTAYLQVHRDEPGLKEAVAALAVAGETQARSHRVSPIAPARAKRSRDVAPLSDEIPH